MTQDIVAKLYEQQFAAPAWMRPTIHEAAAEIVRLREYVPQPMLTDAEREAIERAYCSLIGVEDMSAECSRWDAEAAATLRGLLERTK